MFGKTEKWTGRDLFERMKKNDILEEANAPFLNRVRSKMEAWFAPSIYQKTLKKQWDGLGKHEKPLWEKLADEMNEPEEDRDDDDLLIIQYGIFLHSFGVLPFTHVLGTARSYKRPWWRFSKV
jgi:hypothetical protein